MCVVRRLSVTSSMLLATAFSYGVCEGESFSNSAGRALFTASLLLDRNPGSLGKFIEDRPCLSGPTCTLDELRACCDSLGLPAEIVRFPPDKLPVAPGIYLVVDQSSDVALLRTDRPGGARLVRPPGRQTLVEADQPSGLMGVALRLGRDPEPGFRWLPFLVVFVVIAIAAAVLRMAKGRFRRTQRTL